MGAVSGRDAAKVGGDYKLAKQQLGVGMINRWGQGDVELKRTLVGEGALW